jgi:uncharacterized protein (UPF0332 family)
MNELIELAEECLNEAKALLNLHFVKGAINRCYYSYFDAVRALLELNEFNYKTHSGSHNKFYELYIKTGLIPKKYHQILVELFNKRSQVDYDGFGDIEEESVKEYIEITEEFINYIKTNFNKN